ncbi:MAG: 2-hydroxyacid dehydrogenase [Ruminococcus sp.]|nr:2-hydroxyacid dehydrogenase [Candidatus Apopatosoma intestinale]
MKIAFFDAKDYEKRAFESRITGEELSLVFFDTRLGPETVPLAMGFDAVCIFVNDVADKTVVEALTRYGVRLIALRCAGYNQVDLQAASGKITVVRVPAYSPHAVAEHAMALLLCSIRRIHKAYNRTKDFNFSLNGLAGFNLYGKTVGIIGMGRIGQAFAEICRGFGMEILAYDKVPSDSGVSFCSLDELFEKSDILSLHCPLTKETYHMIDRESILKMKKGVVLLNTSRGALIHSEALLEGIKERKIGAACLDVYEEESDFFFEDFSGHIMEDDVLARLLSMPNVIVTSHQAFLTEEALDAIAGTTVNNILTFFAGLPVPNEISYS